MRTWVASGGGDSNPCTRTAPCKSFAGAIAKTKDGGIVNVLDPGSYGAVTISQPVTIDGGPNATSVAVGAGQTAITVAAPAGKAVNLRNLTLNKHVSVRGPGPR